MIGARRADLPAVVRTAARPTRPCISKINTGAQLLYVMLVLLDASAQACRRARFSMPARCSRSPPPCSPGAHYLSDLRTRRAWMHAGAAAKAGAAMRQLPLGVRLPDRALFASFLPARNAEALEHARRVAAGEVAGLTWLCGPRGAAARRTCCRRSAAPRASACAPATCRSRELAASRHRESSRGCRSLSACAWTILMRWSGSWQWERGDLRAAARAAGRRRAG